MTTARKWPAVVRSEHVTMVVESYAVIAERSTPADAVLSRVGAAVDATPRRISEIADLCGISQYRIRSVVLDATAAQLTRHGIVAIPPVYMRHPWLLRSTP